MFTTRLVVVARKLKRRVHAFIESIDTCHRDFIEFAYSNSTSGAKVFDVFENWVTSAWCVFPAFGFSFRQLFSPFRSPFFFLLFFISCTNRSNSSLFSKRRGIFCRSFTPLATPHCEHTKLLRETFSLIATASLSLCTWPSFLARILQFKYSNVLLSCSYLCFPRFHIHLPSINHRAIHRFFSLLFNFYILLLRLTFSFLSLASSPPRFCSCFPANRRRGGEEKIAHSGATISGIGNEFNELASSHPFRVPAVPPTEPRFSAYPLRLVEKRHRLVLRIRVESWPGNRAYERTPFIARRRPPSFTPRLDRAQKIDWEELREVEDE